MKPLIWLRNQATVFNPRPAVRRARLAYFAAGERAIDVVAAMDTLEWDDSTGRARLMLELASYEGVMGGLVTHCRWNQNEDVEQSHTHRTTALLLRVIADAEVAPGPSYRDHGPAQWEQAFGAHLDDISDQVEPDPAYRAEVMTRLYIAAYPVVGGGAAEVITCLRDAYTRLALARTPAFGQEQSA